LSGITKYGFIENNKAKQKEFMINTDMLHMVNKKVHEKILLKIRLPYKRFFNL